MDPGTQTAVGRAEASRSGPSLIKRVAEVARRDFGPALTGSVLPFALVLYLALRGGGYDRVVYSEVGIAVWWLVLLGALVGVLPAARISRAGWITLGLLTAFVAWTALGITWSESAERTAAEAGRVAAYLGVFALALTGQGREGLRRTANALAAAIAIVGVVALLSRLQPAWFPADEGAAALPGELANRLRYPLDYWNGVAGLMAMGIPLVLEVALRARHLVTQAVATAALPAMALSAFYTFSRGGAVAIGLALLAYIALHPRRLAMLPTLAVAGAGSALLIAAATQRNALENHVLTDPARPQGDEMLAIVLIVCAGVALLQVAIGLAARHELGPRPTITRRRSAALVSAAAAAVVVVALAAGVPGEIADRWGGDQSVGASLGSERFESFSTENRTRYWDSALDANATAPVIGIGPGTFEFWWARNGDWGFIRDAHSLFFETLAEVGIVGVALLASFFAFVLGTGARRLLRSDPPIASTLAAALASILAFTVSAAVDWVWELPALPVAFLLLAAAILGPLPGRTAAASRRFEPGPSARPWERAAVVALAIAALVAIAVPYLSTRFVRESQSQLRAGEHDSALQSAETAQRVEPFAATASTQEAVVLERSGDIPGAVDAAREATRDEPTNYRTWLLLANLEAERGRAAEAIRAYMTGFEQNPRSRVFLSTPPAEFAARLRR
jgi:O-Antigen ligase